MARGGIRTEDVRAAMPALIRLFDRAGGPGAMRRADPAILTGWGTRDLTSGSLRPWAFLREENAWATFYEPELAAPLVRALQGEPDPAALREAIRACNLAFGHVVRNGLDEDRRAFWRDMGYEVVPVVLAEIDPTARVLTSIPPSRRRLT